MYSILKTVLSHEELKDNQKTGKHNTCDNVHLLTRYADRWKWCEQLFGQWQDSELAKTEREKLSDNGQVKFYFRRDDLPGSINFDVYPVPLNIECEDRNEYLFPERTAIDVLECDYISRTKFIIKEFQVTDYFINQERTPVYDYFMSMYVDFAPVLEEYRKRYFSNVDTFFSLNIIKYSVPFATPDNVWWQRKANARLWGVEHYDQNYAGLHLGESSNEFRAYDHITDTWKEVDFNNKRTLFMWGDPAVTNGVTNENWIGTQHGMVAPSKSDTNKDRYSIIFDIVPGKSGL